MSLGYQLIKAREKTGYTQKQVSRLLNISQSTYCDWESDTIKPKAENYLKIADLFNLDLKDLILGSSKIKCRENIDFLKPDKYSPEVIVRLADSVDKLVIVIEKLLQKERSD